MILAVVMMALFARTVEVKAEVNLQWRMKPTKLFVGDIVEVGLYAVSDSELDQSLAGIDVILSWDPNVLELTGLNNNGPYIWFASMFLDDSKLAGLNDTWADGDALYSALPHAFPSPPAIATPGGLLVTTFVFQAVSTSLSSELSILPEFTGSQATTFTRVVTDDPVGDIITGTLGSILIEVLPCGFSGDIDFDCGIDLDDYRQLFPCFTGPDQTVQIIPCFSSDFNGDQHIDLRDFQIFQQLYNGN